MVSVELMYTWATGPVDYFDFNLIPDQNSWHFWTLDADLS